MRRIVIVILLVLACTSIALTSWQRYAAPSAWTDGERRAIDDLWLGNLPPLPPDPSNAVADDLRAAEFGHRLFFDPRLSANSSISCATCHQPQRGFTDGLPRGVALGLTQRNTASIVASAYSPWLYWDGRKDSQWSQALEPLEAPMEHGSNREQIVGLVASDDDYSARYRTLFGTAPSLQTRNDIDRAFANIGKAIAAYERLLLPGESRFDRYAAHLRAGGDYWQQDILEPDELRGLRLFIGAARCTECHNGPLFTNNEFHNTGQLSAAGELPDRARIDGVRIVVQDPFNCRGEFSDASPGQCAELEFVRTGPELIGATRTPSLRNLVQSMPFQSHGQTASLAEVLEHYRDAPPAMIGHNEAKALSLSDADLERLEAFLGTLAAPLAVDEKWLQPPGDQ